MADVFLSYKREDRAYAEDIASALERAGYSIWWDKNISPRMWWDREIEREIQEARAVLVLWTINSVAPDSFVRAEADFAKEQNKLVGANMDGCSLPLAFRLLQATDLRRWSRRETRSQEWRRTLRAIAELVGRDPEAEPPVDVSEAAASVLEQRGRWLADFDVDLRSLSHRSCSGTISLWLRAARTSRPARSLLGTNGTFKLHFGASNMVI